MIRLQKDSQRALEEGLGFKRTKAGPGDKSVAYTVGKNHCQRICLGLSLFFFAFFCSFISYTRWFHRAKWDAVSSELFHYATENNAQTKLLETQLILKDTLESLLHQTHRVAEYRSYLENTLEKNGAKLTSVLAEETHLSKDFTDAIVKDNDIVGSKAIKELDAILVQFRSENRKAKKILNSLSGEIIDNVNDNKQDHEKYHEKLKNLGVTSKSTVNKLKNERWQEIHDQQVEAIERMNKKIEGFFKKLVEVPEIQISENTIAKWEALLKEIMITLEDDAKEADIHSLINQVNQMMLQDGNGQILLFDPSEDRSIVDYLKAKIDDANLAHHRAPLMELYEEWKSGEKRSNIVLRELEKLSQHHISAWRKANM